MGVFSMDGVIADLAAICDLADKYQALGDGRRLPCLLGLLVKMVGVATNIVM